MVYITLASSLAISARVRLAEGLSPLPEPSTTPMAISVAVDCRAQSATDAPSAKPSGRAA